MRRRIKRKFAAFFLGITVCFYLVPMYALVVHADELIEPMDKDYRYEFDFTSYSGEEGNETMYFSASPRDKDGEIVYVRGKLADIIDIECPNKALRNYDADFEEIVENVGSTSFYVYSDVKAYGAFDHVINASEYPGDTTYDRVVAYCLKDQDEGVQYKEDTRERIDESYGDRRRIAWRQYKKRGGEGKIGGEIYRGPSLLWEEEGNLIVPITELGLSENFDAVVKISYKAYCHIWAQGESDNAAAIDAYGAKNITEYEQKTEDYINLLLDYDFDPHITREMVEIQEEEEEEGERQHKTEVSEALKETGLEDVSSIPSWVFVIPPALVIPAVIKGVTGRKNKSGGKNKEKPRQEEPEEPLPTYDMGIYKDFGDTLIAGEKPVLVGARIIEYKPGYPPRTHQEFTRMIRPGSTGYLTVEDDGTPGEYHQAWVSAPKNGDAPSTAAVNFTFSYLGGSYTRQIVFKIAGEPEIEFEDWNKMGIYFVQNMIWGDGKTYYVRVRLKNFS